MSKFGGWEASFSNNYPQKIATALGNIDEVLGVQYQHVAYLGKQNVNGTNHAVLSQQTVLNGRDINNAVMLVLNEKPGGNDVSLTEIRMLVESGGELGGTKVEVTPKIPQEAMDAFKEATDGWVGTRIEPLVYLGSKMENGITYKLLAKVTGVGEDVYDLAIITVGTIENSIRFERVFERGSEEEFRMNYSIVNGVKKNPIALNSPLGEWP